MDVVNKKDNSNKCIDSDSINVSQNIQELMENNIEHLVACSESMQSNEDRSCPQFTCYGRKYGCTICGKCFKTPSLVQRHLVTHTKDKPFQCNICSKSFTQKSSFQRHLHQSHTNEKVHVCVECNRSFAQRSNLTKHLQQAHQPKLCAPNFACDRCSCSYTSLNILNRHKTQFHSAEVETEAARVAKLAATYRDETTIDDADELARSVLVELKKLQGGMMENVEHSKVKAVENIEKCSKNDTECNADLVEDTGTLDLVEVCDRLNPLSQPHAITVQCIRRNDGIAFYVCEFCAKEFKKSYDLIRHRRIHLHEKPYKCEKCKRCFITKSKLVEHKQWHALRDSVELNKQLFCGVCGQIFHSVRRLDAHANLHAQTHSLLYNCSTCSRSYRSFGAFLKHKHRQIDKELEMVYSLLPAPIVLTAEVYGKNVSDVSKQFKCQSCERLFSSKSQLNCHYKIHTTHKQFVCPKCNLTFSMASRLQRHLLCHSKERNFKCVYCAKTYKRRAHCRQHMQLHLKELLNQGGVEKQTDDSANEPKKCVIVVQETTQQTTATASTHSTPKFIELQSLPQYRRHKHRNITINTVSQSSIGSPKTCHYCQREFKKPNDLQRHLRTHTKERPFRCNLCEKSFTLASTLKDHLMTHSQQRATHACQVCGKSYASKKVLKLHLRIHTGERPFKCTQCAQTFRTSGHLQAHMKANHKNDEEINKLA